MEALFFTHATLVTPHEVLEDYSLLTEGEKIAALGKSGTITCPPHAKEIDLQGKYLVPGYIDLQVNGAFGKDFTAEPDTMWEVAKKLPRYGVTSFLPTIITSPFPTYQKAQEVFSKGKPSDWYGAEPLGLHFEGPFLNPHKKGAHNEAHIIPPDIKAVENWTPEGGVKLVTLAPEMEGALELIKVLTKRGVVVSSGHTNATYQQAIVAFEAGCTYGTHLFNAMPPLLHREPGMVGAVLASDSVYGGVIPDGLHVHKAMVKVLWRVLGAERLVAVTDCMAALGMPSGRYHLADLEVVVTEESARLLDGTIAGSILSLDAALRNLMAYTQAPLEACLQSLTSTPAKMMGLQDRGRLAVGYYADMNVLSASYHVEQTIIKGKVWQEL